MSKYKKKKLIVAECFLHTGVVGHYIENYKQKHRRKIKMIVERNRRLGPIDNDKVVLIEYPDIQTLDPREWKEQDHYAVIGIPNLRSRATQAQIKNAYKKQVLKHHPDKRRARGGGKQASSSTGGSSDSDDYFSCIQKAFEVLGNEEARRSYDSVDPRFDNSVPAVSKHSKENFYSVFGPVFEANQRWCMDDDMSKVPCLGDDLSSMEEVNEFYEYWYDFKSWREYSYEDEVNKETAEDAYDRRQMEKQNRAVRAQKKKEEMKRLRLLVDNAYACDPRIKQYKEDAIRRKNANRAARAEATKRALEEKRVREEEERVRADEEKRRREEEEKQAQQDAKRKKDKEKKLLKKERQKLQKYCKEKEYFHAGESEGAVRIEFMDRLNHLCASLDLLTITQLNTDVQQASDTQQAHHIISVKLDELRDQMVKEREQQFAPATTATTAQNNSNGDSNKKKWTSEDTKLLIKAVTKFPAGTITRWKVISNYMNTHGSSVVRDAKDCLSRAKSLTEDELKADANHNAFEKFQEAHQSEQVKNQAKPKDGEISQRFDGESKPWSKEEQKILEQALRTFPPSTPERWERISETLTGRTRRECMIRFKELADRVKAKKLAMAAAAQKK